MARLRQPLAKVSQKSLDWRRYKAEQREAVQIRFVKDGMKCEGHGERIYQAPEVHHVFGRRQIVGEPWASSAELCAALCHNDIRTGKGGCHEIVTRHLDPKLELRLQEKAVERFYAKHGAKVPKRLNPIGAVIALVAKLEKEGGRVKRPQRWNFSIQSDEPLERPLFNRGW